MAQQPEGIGQAAAGGPQVVPDDAPERVDPVFTAMAWLVGLDFLLGIGSIIAVPYGRPSAWLPVKGRALYVPHAVLGALLAVGALYLIARYRSATERIPRLAAKTGIAGIIVGVIGGFLAVDHPLRLIGMALMLIGGLVASIGYATPSLSAHDKKERARLAAEYAEDQGGPFA